jgi:hypothetical protein
MEEWEGERIGKEMDMEWNILSALGTKTKTFI